MDNKETILLDHIGSQIDTQKNMIKLFYSNLKLKLPTYIKTLTIGELRKAGAIIDTSIYVPREVEVNFRARANASTKRLAVHDKLLRIQNQHRGRIIAYYKELRQQIPEELRPKTLGELTDTEWRCLGVEPKD